MNLPDYILQFRKKDIGALNVEQGYAVEAYITTLVSEAEARGRSQAVDYIADQVESFSDLETKAYGADTTVDEYQSLLESARNAKPV